MTGVDVDRESVSASISIVREPLPNEHLICSWSRLVELVDERILIARADTEAHR